MIRYIAAATGLVIAVSFAASQAREPDSSQGPVLAELFTSQGCSSCPPAERLFASLADNPDYVTIEWHVDYWDDLVHGGSRWKDPFSSPEFTARQRDYNVAIRGTRSVYTPQAVLGGAHEFVGSRPAELAFARPLAPKPTLQLSAADGAVTITGTGAGDVWFVRLRSKHSTDVKAGENKGRVLEGRNVAKELVRLGATRGATGTFTLPDLAAGETCAIFVQSRTADSTLGPILGATYCPKPTSAPAR